MLTESFVAATETVKPPATHLSSTLKDVGIFLHEFQPQVALRHGYKKSSIAQNCLAISSSHIFASQVGKAIINVYSRTKGNQEATVPFPQKITCLVYAEKSAILILGTQDGKLVLWEVATGRVSTSSASHIEAVTSLVVSPDGEFVISASPDSLVHAWSIRNLVSIGEKQSAFNNDLVQNDPISTFTQHRSPVTALAVGHSQRPMINFTVSASDDQTCYIWNLATTQILRTILLQATPQCAVIDPADRAVYIGIKESGGVVMIDLFEEQGNPHLSILSNSSQDATAPRALRSKLHFASTMGPEVGIVKCITISYDGTRLLTGHESGKVLQWDVAKRRMTAEVSSLAGQPVTNIQMLRPNGFITEGPRYTMSTVVKPRLELTSNTTENGTLASSAIPAEYSFQAQVLRDYRNSSPDDIETAMMTSSIPQSMIDAAVQSLARNKVSLGNKQSGMPGENMSNEELYKVESMEKEIASLKSQLALHRKQDQERLENHLDRLRRRDEVGLEKRKAFFAAKKDGKNGDEAMKPFMQLESNIDVESDEEAIAEDVTNDESKHRDTEMKG